jgi:hypothetical protein
MRLGWIVVKFEKGKDSEQVFFSWDKVDVLDMADELNETAPQGTWYGWQRST